MSKAYAHNIIRVFLVVFFAEHMKNGALRATSHLLRVSRQISQSKTTAMSTLILHGTVHGRIGGLCATTGTLSLNILLLFFYVCFFFLFTTSAGVWEGFFFALVSLNTFQIAWHDRIVNARYEFTSTVSGKNVGTLGAEVFSGMSLNLHLFIYAAKHAIN